MISALAPTLALAQPMGRPGAGRLPEDDGKVGEEGPAEQAPEKPEQKGAVPPPKEYPGQESKRVLFLQLNGYLRGRTDFFHNFNLDLPSLASAKPAFPLSVECNRMGGAPDFSPCQANLSTANMRLRLEPTVNVSETVRVRAQVDMLDNVVFGSTPEGYFIGTDAPSRPPASQINAFARSQIPPQAGRNALEDSIQVKRAWAEVRTPFGELRFGRMPSHWGAGMLVNDGTCLDCNYGVSADRIMFATRPSGPTSPYLAFGAFDWVHTGPTSFTLDIGRNRAGGQAFDATNRDDVSQYILGGGRIQKPEDFENDVATEGRAVNYGIYFVYRSQEDDIINVPLGTDAATAAGGNTLINRDAWAIIPDLWFRLALKKFRFEVEVAGIAGSVGSATELTQSNEEVQILQLGGVARSEFRFLDESLRLGLEAGFATGDQSEPLDSSVNQFFGGLDVPPPGDTTVTRFRFDPDYQIDLIFWREIVGQVTNAIYFKPWLAYDFDRSWGFKIDAIHSMSHTTVSTPGNARNYGLEFDFHIGYRNKDDGFFAGFQYGFFVPMGALDHPADLFEAAAAPTGTAQVLKTQMIVKF